MSASLWPSFRMVPPMLGTAATELSRTAASCLCSLGCPSLPRARVDLAGNFCTYADARKAVCKGFNSKVLDRPVRRQIWERGVSRGRWTVVSATSTISIMSKTRSTFTRKSPTSKKRHDAPLPAPSDSSLGPSPPLPQAQRQRILVAFRNP